MWEVTNVFLVFFFVGIVGFFPKTAYYYGYTLLVPVSISIILLAIRGSYYAFSTYGLKDHKLYMFLYGITGLFIPASLSIVLTISEGGFIDLSNNHPTLLYKELFISPFTWSIVLLSIVSALYISANFLTYYANEGGDIKARDLLWRYTIIWSGPTILSAMLIIYQLKYHNPAHFWRIMDLSWMLIGSFILFVFSHIS